MIIPLLDDTNFEHSRLDLPVVITSSTINTFELSGIEKSLRPNSN